MNNEKPSGEPEGRAESAAEPHTVVTHQQLEEWCHPAAPVVSASPAPCLWPKSGSCSCQPKNPNHTFITGAATQPVAANLPEPSDLECQGEWCKRVHVAICGGTPSATHEEMHGCGKTISFEEMFRCADCRVPFHQHCLKKHFNEHTGLANPPKVQDIARKVAIELCAELVNSDPLLYCPATVKRIENQIIEFLGPLFTQVSQPPTPQFTCDNCVSVDICMERNYCDKAGRPLAAPVIPVSPANIMHRAFDFQPFREAAKRIDEVIDTASLDEIRIQLRSLSAELKQRESVAPISGNGTEPPPDDLRTALQNIIPICKYNGNRTGDGNWAKIELIAERALAGAASHNVQGWEAKLRNLIAAKEPNGYPLWFNRAVHACKDCDSEDCCDRHHAIAARDFTGCDEFVSQFMAALPAPPSEADGPQPKEND